MIYSYRCVSCKANKDFDFPVGTAPKIAMSSEDCPTCRETRAYKRNFQIAGIEFKGSGFYSTDNRKGYVDPDIRREIG